MKINIVLLILMLVSVNSVYSQSWELKKEIGSIKAFTADKENSSTKRYKVIGMVNAGIDCVYSTVIDFDNYTQILNNLSDSELLSKNDSVIIAYLKFELSWPISDRDLIAKVKINKTENVIKLFITAIKYPKFKIDNKAIRLIEYSEKLVIESINDKQTKISIIGHVDVGGSIPNWVKNMFIVDNPINLIEFLNSNCNKQ